VTTTQLQQLLQSRRSIQPKDYTGKAVPESAMQTILEAAPWAPNHGKTEPWRFAVYAGESKRKLLDATLRWYEGRPAAFWGGVWLQASTGKPEFPDYESFADYFRAAAIPKWERASHLVAICVRRQRATEGKKQFPQWEEDAAVACAVQNMHLMATALNVGAYWSSWYAHYREDDACARDLGMNPEQGDRCLGIFVIGDVLKDTLRSQRATRLPVSDFATWH